MAGDGLLVGRVEPHLAGQPTTDEAKAAQWFAQDDFVAAPTLDSVDSGDPPPRRP